VELRVEGRELVERVGAAEHAADEEGREGHVKSDPFVQRLAKDAPHEGEEPLVVAAERARAVRVGIKGLVGRCGRAEEAQVAVEGRLDRLLEELLEDAVVVDAGFPEAELRHEAHPEHPAERRRREGGQLVVAIL